MFKVLIDSYGEIYIGVEHDIKMVILTTHEYGGNSVTLHLEEMN